jgi:23S rRNA (guanosine2251-2'-O)-methyltransferase
MVSAKKTTVIYGINPVREALAGEGLSISKIFVADPAGRARQGHGKGGKAAGRESRALGGIIRSAEALGIPLERTSAAAITRATGTPKHQGVAAMVRGEFASATLDDVIERVQRAKEAGRQGLVLVLDSLKDPGNVGSLIRAALSAGAQGVVMPRDRACPVTPAVAKASAGAVSHIPVARVTNLVRAIEELKEHGLWTVALEADGTEDIYSVDLAGDTAIIVGSEGEGVRRLVRKASDQCAFIPMAGAVGSLNAAQAGAIAIFEARRQRLASKGE